MADRHRWCSTATALALSLSLAKSAIAGGLYVQEFGTPSMGTADSGAQAIAVDASTAFHNPAGMTRLDGRQIMLGGGFIASEIRFDPRSSTPESGGDGGNAGGFGPLLGSYFAQEVNDRISIGVATFSISGAVLNYEKDWTGRFQAQDVKLLTITTMPSLAFRVNDQVSVGFGLPIMYSRLDFKLVAPVPGPGDQEVRVELQHMDAWDVGFQASGLFEINDRTRLGVIYQSEIDPKLTGEVAIFGDRDSLGGVATDTKLPFVQFVRGSLYHEFNDQWAILFTAAWEDWSSFDNQWVSVGTGGADIPRNWNDTWHVGVGVHYRVKPNWLLQAGFGYDSSPVGARDRTADMPIDEQWRVAVGVQHEITDRWKAGASFVFADYGKGRINSSNLVGDYKHNELYFVGVNTQWSFD